MTAIATHIDAIAELEGLDAARRLNAPSLEHSPGGAAVLRRVKAVVHEVVGEAIPSEDVEWIVEETLYQLAHLARTQQAPADCGYCGTFALDPREEAL